MKKSILWLLLALLLIGLIGGASILYTDLSDRYENDNLLSVETDPPRPAEKPGDSETAETTEHETEENKTDSDKSDALDAPDFTVYDADGNAVKLSDFRGKPVVLNFWATWCYYCKMEMPDFDTAYADYPQVQFLMVNATDGVQETFEKAKQYVADQGFAFPVFYDTDLEALNAYRITSFPTTYFIDGEGKIIARGVGMLDMDSLVRGINMIIEEAE